MSRLLLFPLLLVPLTGQTYQDYRTFLEREEGIRTRVYLDTRGNQTIGVGHVIKPGERFKGPLSPREIDALFAQDLKVAIAGVRRMLPSFSSQPSEVRLVCVGLAYQCGVTGFAGFKRLRNALEQFDYALAERELMNSKWAREFPARAERYRLLLTRAREGVE